MENEDSSGLYELSGLKAIFEEIDKQKEIEKIKEQENFWDGVETDYWEKEQKKEFNETVKKMELVDDNLVINRKRYYKKVAEKTKNLDNEMSKDIFEDDFKEIKKPEDGIDPFWLS